MTDQGERHHFQGREHGTDREGRGRGAGKVEVVQRAEHSAGQEDDRGEQHGMVGGAAAQKAQLDRQERDGGGREDLEEAFHPQVDDPPAPVFDHRQVRVLAPGQTRAVEQADGDRRQEEDDRERLALARLSQRRPKRTAHQDKPDHQPGKQQDLPEPAKIDIFPTLVTEPEIHVEVEVLLDAEPFAGHRADDHDEQRAEQHVNADLLEFRLAAAQRRGEIETGGEPCGRDPEDAELGVPGPGYGVGQDFRQRETVEVVTLDRIVRCNRPEPDLGQEQGDNDPEILAGRLH